MRGERCPRKITRVKCCCYAFVLIIYLLNHCLKKIVPQNGGLAIAKGAQAIDGLLEHEGLNGLVVLLEGKSLLRPVIVGVVQCSTADRVAADATINVDFLLQCRHGNIGPFVFGILQISVVIRLYGFFQSKKNNLQSGPRKT